MTNGVCILLGELFVIHNLREMHLPELHGVLNTEPCALEEESVLGMVGLSCDKSGLSCDRSGLSCDKSGLSCDKSGLSCDRFGLSCDRFGLSCDRSGLSCDRFGLSCDGFGVKPVVYLPRITISDTWNLLEGIAYLIPVEFTHVIQ